MPTHRFHGDRTQTRTGGRYDGRHQAARKQAARRHKDTDLCCRCGHPLGPMGRWLHYDHDEHGGYLGFAHGSEPCPYCRRRCNLSAGARKGNRLQPGHDATLKPRTCCMCGTTYQPFHVRQRCCGATCRARLAESMPRPARPVQATATERTCTECNTTFLSDQNRRITCSRQCLRIRTRRLRRVDPHAIEQDREARRRWRERHPTPAAQDQERRCSECDTPFMAQHTRRLTCGPICLRRRTVRLVSSRQQAAMSPQRTRTW